MTPQEITFGISVVTIVSGAINVYLAFARLRLRRS